MPSKQLILDAVSQALEAMGMTDDVLGDMYGEEEGIGAENTVPIWSQLDAGTLGQGMGQLHDKSALQKAIAAQPSPQTTQYGMPVDDEGAEMMTALGMV